MGEHELNHLRQNAEDALYNMNKSPTGLGCSQEAAALQTIARVNLYQAEIMRENNRHLEDIFTQLEQIKDKID